MRVVTYTVVTETFSITDAEYDLIYSLYTMENPRKVTAVKFLRNQYGIELKRAKDICD